MPWRCALLASIAASHALARRHALAPSPATSRSSSPTASSSRSSGADLEGWAADDHLAAFDAFQTSCQPFRKVKRPRDERPVYNALWEVCRRTAAVRPPANAQRRARLLRGEFSAGADHPAG